MLTNRLRSKALVALAVPILAIGVSFAGGADCHKKDASVAAGKGAHCNMLSKDIAKSYELTDDGAVVTLAGKSEKAVEHIKAHITSHGKNADCPECPLNTEGVSAEFEVTDKGGVIKAHGSSPETVAAVQQWAKAPAGQCCGGEKGEKA